MNQNSRTAIIVSHGQPSVPVPAELALMTFAAQVQSYLPDHDIQSATLAMPGRLEKVMQNGALIYPFFMAKGWFTAKVLPKRLVGFDYLMAAPFGRDPALPGLSATALRTKAREQGWNPETVSILLAAHGSARGPKAAEATEQFAKALQAKMPQAQIRPGYVEEPPHIDTSAHGLPETSICLPFFAQSGDHVRSDIPQALEAANFTGPVLPVAGALPGSARMVAESIARQI